MKKILLSLSLCLILLLTACGSETIVTQPVEEPKAPQYTVVENENEYTFPISSVSVALTEDMWNYNIFNDFDVYLDTSKEFLNFPYIVENISIYNTAPKVYIIPRYYQLQYSITEVFLENGIITIKYKTDNNPKIDRLIGQLKNVEYTFYAIDLSQLPDGKFSFKLVNENNSIEPITRDFEIKIPKPILTWEIKNISKGKNNDFIYTSNKTGDWQIYKYNINDKTEIQLTDRHSDIDMDSLNMLGYDFHNSNVPKPIYNEEKNQIIYSIGSDIYYVSYDGSRNLPASIDNEDGRTPNGYRVFENVPIPTKSGFKVLYQEIFDPVNSELYWAHLSNLNKKQKIDLPEDGDIFYFNFGRTEKEAIVGLFNRKNTQMNGFYNLWLLDLTDYTKQRKIETHGYKISSLDLSSNKKFIIFSQTLNSAESDMENDLYYVNINNTDLKRITPRDGIKDINPVISPDNSKFVYMSTTNNKNYIMFVSDIDGKNRRQLADFYITEKPYWLNNYELIVVDAFSNILKVNVETGEFETLVDGFDKLDIEKVMNELNNYKEYYIE